MNDSTNCVGGIFGTALGEGLFGFFSTQPGAGAAVTTKHRVKLSV
ncbi:MAG: hypothetical protein AABO41_27230 [Acidobacteriota bacterium]